MVGNDRQPDSRQPASRASLTALSRNDSERAALQYVIQELVTARLLVIQGDRQGQENTIEIIHEALLQHWSALKYWIARDRRFLQWRQELERRVQAWIETNLDDVSQRDEGRLVRGRDLAAAEDMLNTRGDELTDLQREYILASQKQLADELEKERRANRRLGVRRVIGMIGLALPFVLIFGTVILNRRLVVLDDISAYYYSPMRDVFVGSLFAVAILLFTYRYERWGWDDILGDLAGVFAIGVALFPTVSNVGVTAQQVTIGWVHVWLTACFLFTLAYFALVLFRKTDPHKVPTHGKRQRNLVYLVCGITIVACPVLIILLGLVPFLPVTLWLRQFHPVLWLESLAFYAFGSAWFVKGGTIVKDE